MSLTVSNGTVHVYRYIILKSGVLGPSYCPFNLTVILFFLDHPGNLNCSPV